jgi:ankyrin repeat protein
MAYPTCTPLGAAAYSCARDAACALLDAGAGSVPDDDDDEDDHLRVSAMQIASWRGSFDLVELLVEKGQPLDGALGYAIERGAFDIARFLIESGAMVNDCHGEYADRPDTERGRMPLFWRVCENIRVGCDKTESIALANFMIEHGLDVNFSDDGLDATPIFAAIMSGQAELVCRLIRGGANLGFKGRVHVQLKSDDWEDVEGIGIPFRERMVPYLYARVLRELEIARIVWSASPDEVIAMFRC